jgi:hypothetical protein
LTLVRIARRFTSQQTAALAVYAAMVLHKMRTEDLEGDTDQDDAKFEGLCELCAERVSQLKALTSAWGQFCDGLGVSASDLDKMTGLPLLGSGGTVELIEETVGEVAVDEDYQRECLDHLTGFWGSVIRDRHPA